MALPFSLEYPSCAVQDSKVCPNMSQTSKFEVSSGKMILAFMNVLFRDIFTYNAD